MKGSQNMFMSYLNLKYNNFEIENQYLIVKYKTIDKSYKMFSYIMFILSIFASIVDSLHYGSSWKTVVFKFTVFTSYAIAIFYLIVIILMNSIKLNQKLKMLIHYSNYYLLLFIIGNLRYPANQYFSKQPFLFFMVLLFEFLYRLILIFVEQYTFVEIVIITSITLCTSWGVFFPQFIHEIPKEMLFDLAVVRQLPYSFSHILMIVFAYIFQKQYKQYFYINYINEKKNDWLMNIFENMKTGFLNIQKKDTFYISYLNSFLIQKLESIQSIKNILLERNISINSQQNDLSLVVGK